VGSHSVNGVAKLHTDILKASVFREFHEFFPKKFNNKTNGVTPRRWMLKANPRLSALITETIGDRWITDLSELRKLEAFVEDAAFRDRWQEVKLANKRDFSQWIHGMYQLDSPFDPATMYDIQVKRIHEYKRQLLNALHVIDMYNRIVDGEDLPARRTVMFGGKAAPGYVMAKLIIKLINSVADMVNKHPRAGKQLRVHYLANYGVSCAERIFPACDLSEQISTAGTEASGTGNMKAAMNGALTIGTLDGANVEIREEVGPENIFIFGHTADEVVALRNGGYNPQLFVDANLRLRRVIDTIATGELDRAQPGLFKPIVDALIRNDRYFHCADFASYIETQQEAAHLYRREEEWTRKSILNVAGMGRFSSDRTIAEYAADIWRAQPVDASKYSLR
jgi:starch phosphorylase